jgi:hypothetical protein
MVSASDYVSIYIRMTQHTDIWETNVVCQISRTVVLGQTHQLCGSKLPELADYGGFYTRSQQSVQGILAYITRTLGT